MTAPRNRFEGIAKSYGELGLQKLSASHIAVVGLGGVGSWTVETLVRSGVGHITIMDLDDICLSNTNRQIHALEGTYGKLKSTALELRCQQINPDCKVSAVEDFLDESSLENLFENKFDFVIDCIDSTINKSLLIAHCYHNKIPIATVGAAGGRIDPTKIHITDLNKSFNDRLLFRVRKILKRKFKISKGGRNNLHIPCVFSSELVDVPELNRQNCDLSGDEFNLANDKLNCQGTMGSVMHITATMGMMAASIAINRIAQDNLEDGKTN